MLTATFRFGYDDVFRDKAISDLLRSFEIQKPKRNIRPPAWDLSKVLDYLSKAPFEPLGDASFSDLSKKVLFLVALATAKRVGELQHLSSQVAARGADLVVAYLSEFLAKTQTVSQGGRESSPSNL